MGLAERGRWQWVTASTCCHLCSVPTSGQGWPLRYRTFQLQPRAWSSPGDRWLGLVLFRHQCGLQSRRCQLGSGWDLHCGETWLIPESLQPLPVSPSLSLSSVAADPGRAAAPHQSGAGVWVCEVALCPHVASLPAPRCARPARSTPAKPSTTPSSPSRPAPCSTTVSAGAGGSSQGTAQGGGTVQTSWAPQPSRGSRPFL